EATFSPFMPVREVIHKEESLKCLVFYLKPGQRIDLHRSPRRVLVIVLEGEGEFFVGSTDKRERLRKGELIIYEPEEPHGFQAIEDMVVMALVV
ncbi:MAG: cupin domain-containing protein, partial [Aquificaceae bacterium]|nr:cupin domain-containing protein [Aquificaceae bacterium]